MKQLLLAIVFSILALPLTAQSIGETTNRPPKYEVRAAWITGCLWFGLATYPCHHARKYPETKGQNLIEILDRLERCELQHRTLPDTDTR